VTAMDLCLNEALSQSTQCCPYSLSGSRSAVALGVPGNRSTPRREHRVAGSTPTMQRKSAGMVTPGGTGGPNTSNEWQRAENQLSGATRLARLNRGTHYADK
jgi:hypothetical protein